MSWEFHSKLIFLPPTMAILFVMVGHFGQAKMKLRRDIGIKVITNRQQILSAFESLKNTKVNDLGPISIELPLVESFPLGIRKYFQFRFEKEGIFWCREVSDEGNWFKQ